MADLQLVSDDLGELQRQAAEFTPNKDKAAIGENILGLRLLCLYGLKGAAAYTVQSALQHGLLAANTVIAGMKKCEFY